jgi:uncharacterized Fe-S cluster-containing radical SAM superfamily protein
MYDPVELAEGIAEVVTRGDRRKYYRFRRARFYGGIATADCVGCCLRCAFCWAWKRVVDPEGSGSFYSPEQVAHRITAIARKNRLTLARLSGNEPTLARQHLLAVLRGLPEDIHFVLETNGILIGHDANFASDLAGLPRLHVRVSLKGSCPEEFSRLTGAIPAAFDLQLKALYHLVGAGASCHAAVMASFSSPAKLASLRQTLASIEPGLADFEAEEAVMNPGIEARLARCTDE